VTTLRSQRAEAAARRLWLAAVCLLAVTPVLGLFTRSKIFYIRDLSFFFWSRHLWLRHTLLSGTAPWWDPYVAGGQSAIVDALNQILMPITLAIRLLPSDVVSFNLWVALPLPFAAVGMFLFLEQTRKHGSSAALGAAVFTLAGVTVSMLNTPNLAWCVAGLPWVMWTTERLLDAPTVRRMAGLAVIYALQALTGEPVTGAATAVVGLTYAVAGPRPESGGRDSSGRRRLPGLIWVGVGIGVGGLLAAAQLVPTFLAGVNAHRGNLASPDFWSVHPLTLVEVIAPHLFGNYYDAFLADIPWMTVLNSGRDPFFYSLYVGPLVLLVAATAIAMRPRRSIYWIAIFAVFTVASFGGYTPIYPFVRKIVTPLSYFRFPIKYLAISVFACATLAAEGWESVREPSSDRLMRVARAAGVAALTMTVIVLLATFAHQWSWARAYSLAAWLKITRPDTAADLVMRLGPPLFGRAAGLLFAGAALLAVAASGGPRARPAAYLLLIAVCVDLAITNGGLNLTSDVAKLTPPDWYVRLSGSERVYIGGRVRGFMNTADRDAAQSWQIPPERTAVEGRMELNAELPMAPSGWRVREALSYDLPVLWPSEYEAVVRAFEHAGRAERDAFLRRSGVRWCVLPSPPGEAIAVVAHWEGLKVVECGPTATRVFVTTVGRTGGDFNWQRAALFDPAAPDDELRMASMPALSGAAGAAVPPAARIVEDGANEVIVDASLPSEGFLVLRDSYDVSWRAAVDGRPAEMARANALYRAVRLPAGRHEVRFRYRPRPLLIGLRITGMTALVLSIACVMAAPRKRRASVDNGRGFTLVELMIVMAIIGIILAIAFARYQGMEARGNESSAIGSMRSIASAQWSFAQTCGNQKYAPTLVALGQPAQATGTAFLSPDLTSDEIVEKSGYQFQITAEPNQDPAVVACNGAQLAPGYAATADPITPGRSGTRFFGLNGDRVLFEDSQTFKESMPKSGAPEHGVEVR
jgi:prepilin-type N-terminal cleavage/methylation domain-containing protein